MILFDNLKLVSSVLLTISLVRNFLNGCTEWMFHNGCKAKNKERCKVIGLNL